MQILTQKLSQKLKTQRAAIVLGALLLLIPASITFATRTPVSTPSVTSTIPPTKRA